jgi:hypothetical protein
LVDLQAGPLQLVTVALDEVLEEHGEVFWPVPQGWQGDHDHPESVVQVLAECAGLQSAAQIAIGRGNDPSVRADIFHAPDPLELLFLQNPQQLGLEGQREIANLIQENRPPVRQLKLPFLLRNRAGERAFLVAKQFAFQQLWGERHTIHGHKGVLGARTPLMDGARYDFLTRTAFAQQQDGGVRRGYAMHQAQHGLHPCTGAADQPVPSLHDLLQCHLGVADRAERLRTVDRRGG